MKFQNQSLLIKAGKLWFLSCLSLITSHSVVNAQQWTIHTQTGTGVPISFDYSIIYQKHDLAIDRDNMVWMILDGKLIRYSPASDEWDQVIPASVSAVFMDREGTVYVKQGKELFRYNGTTFDELFTEPSGTIYDFTADNQGNLWYSPNENGPVVRKFDGATLTDFNLPAIDPCCVNLAIPIRHDGNGAIWTVITDLDVISRLVEVNGAKIYDNTHTDIFNYPVFNLEILKNNNIWAGTHPFDPVPAKGAAYLNRETDTWTTYNTSNSTLPGDTILALKGDHLNRIWISTNRGMTRFDGTEWKVFNINNSPLPSDSTSIIAIDTVGTKWFATAKGLTSFNEITPGYDSESCGLSVTFSDHSKSMDGNVVSWHWDFAGLGTSELSSPTFTFPASGSYQVRLWIKDEKGNRNIISRTIEVNEFTETLSLGDDINACMSSIQLVANITDADSYHWKTPDGTVTANAVTATVSGRYVLEISKQGCIQKDTINVSLNSFTPGSFEMIAGNIQLPAANGTVLTDVDIMFNNTSDAGENFTWNFGDQATSTGSSAKYAYTKPGDYVVTLVGNDDRDCPIIAEKTIHVEDIVITNAISPDGDGKNDKLFIEPLLYEAELKVINRWGQTVYESSAYQDDFTGANLESGVYYYEVYFKAIHKRYKGYVHILKN